MYIYLVGVIPVYLFIWLPLSRIFVPGDLSSRLLNYDFNSSLFIPPNAHDNITCSPHHQYKTYIYSKEPLVIYIEGFLSAEESEHLQKISDDVWETSRVWSGQDEDPKTDTTVRVSETALIPRTPIVQCIEERAIAFQGWKSGLHLERLRTQRYSTGGHYSHHYDNKGGRGADRVSSFMVYVDANCDGGGTAFFLLDTANEKWCRSGFVECSGENGDDDDDDDEHVEGSDDTIEGGVVFKPLKGNAIFWENLRSDGSGYHETFHAGMPVRTGSKIGLNIWTWALPGR